MTRTLILYDGKMTSAERIAVQLCYMVGSALAADIDEAPADLTPYGGFCFVFNFYGTVTVGKTKSFLSEHKEFLSGKRLVMVGIGYSDQGYSKYVVDTEEEIGLDGIAGIFIASEKQTTRAGYEIGKMMRVPMRAVNKQILDQEIRSFIAAHTSMALATGADRYVRCTPLQYLFTSDAFYIVTEGGNKFRGILENGRVSAAIFDPEGGDERASSLHFQGEAEAVPAGTDEYLSVMAEKNLTPERLKALPVTMFLIRITPLRYEYVHPEFEQQGYDAVQFLETEQLRKIRREGRDYVARERSKGQPRKAILGDDGRKKVVTIPEVDVMSGWETSASHAADEDREREDGERERTVREDRTGREDRAGRERAERRARRPRAEADEVDQPLFDEAEEIRSVKTKKRGHGGERKTARKEARKGKNKGGVFGRIGKILLIDEEDGEEDE